MKNIHLIPTDKPSRLAIEDKELILVENIGNYRNAQHIYITNDEEIKEGDYVFWERRVYKYKDFMEMKTSVYTDFFSIILTTDQDLIKDGVQAIDDEFLEWFVKNPSCENIPIITTIINNQSFYKTNIGFELWRKEEVKQETLEEAAERYSENWEEITGLDYENTIPSEINKLDFMNGAKSEAAKEYWFKQFKKK